MPSLQDMSLTELKVAIPPALAEILNDALLEAELTVWNLVEDVLAGEAWVVGVFADGEAAHAAWADLRSLVPGLEACVPAVRTLHDQEWRDSYKAHFKAWQFGRLHWVPVWERESFVLPSGDEVLWLDPGLAFGTGNHETTRLCVERLVAWAGRNDPARRIIDAGCGSGILALSALKLGFTAVEGFDNDEEAVRVSRENAGLNGLGEQAVFYTGDLITGLQGKQADLLMANILADVLMRHAPQLIKAVAPGGQLVLSGILAGELDRVRECFTAVVPRWQVDARKLGDWSDLVLCRDQ